MKDTENLPAFLFVKDWAKNALLRRLIQDAYDIDRISYTCFGSWLLRNSVQKKFTTLTNVVSFCRPFFPSFPFIPQWEYCEVSDCKILTFGVSDGVNYPRGFGDGHGMFFGSGGMTTILFPPLHSQTLLMCSRYPMTIWKIGNFNLFSSDICMGFIIQMDEYFDIKGIPFLQLKIFINTGLCFKFYQGDAFG